jgi:hypothetical protein
MLSHDQYVELDKCKPRLPDLTTHLLQYQFVFVLAYIVRETLT